MRSRLSRRVLPRISDIPPRRVFSGGRYFLRRNYYRFVTPFAYLLRTYDATLADVCGGAPMVLSESTSGAQTGVAGEVWTETGVERQSEPTAINDVGSGARK